jgi:hypothetical protein
MTEIDVDANNEVRADGRRIGSVVQGDNGEWYFVPPSREAWADPLQGLDAKKGTGSPTPMDAAIGGLTLTRSQMRTELGLIAASYGRPGLGRDEIERLLDTVPDGRYAPEIVNQLDSRFTTWLEGELR